MRKLYSILTIFVFGFLISCDEFDTTVDAPNSLSFGKASYSYNFEAAENIYPLVVTATNVSDVDRVVELEILTGINPANNLNYTTALDSDFDVNLSVVIPAGEYSGTADVVFDPASVQIGSNRYVTFSLKNNSDYVYNTTSGYIKLNFTQVCFSNDIVFDLTLDRYGSEISWDIKNSAGAVVQSGGPYTDAASNIVQVLPQSNFTLADGTYTFTIRDIYGDGLYTSATVQGTFSLRKDCGTVLHSGGGNFGSMSAQTFSIP